MLLVPWSTRRDAGEDQEQRPSPKFSAATMNFLSTLSLNVSCGTPSVASSPKMQCGIPSSPLENARKGRHPLQQRPRLSCRQHPALQVERRRQTRQKSHKLAHPPLSLPVYHETPMLNPPLLAGHPPLCTLSDLHAHIVHHSLRLSLHTTPAEPSADLLYVDVPPTL